MRKISEVTKLLGISRRSLQEYDKIGLLKPTAKTEAGYWLYSDEDIYTLIVIQIFVEIGYERKQIKELIQNGGEKLPSEFAKAIKLLEKKKMRIEGMIQYVKQIQEAQNLSPAVIEALTHTNLSDTFRFDNFVSGMQQAIQEAAKLSAEEKTDELHYTPLFLKIYAVCLLKDHDPKDKKVLDCVREMYLEVYRLIGQENSQAYREEELYSPAFLETFRETIHDMTHEELDLRNEIIRKCGEDSIEFLERAASAFISSHTEKK